MGKALYAVWSRDHDLSYKARVYALALLLVAYCPRTTYSPHDARAYATSAAVREPHAFRGAAQAASGVSGFTSEVERKSQPHCGSGARGDHSAPLRRIAFRGRTDWCYRGFHADRCGI